MDAGLAEPVPGAEGRLGIDRAPAEVDLEVEVARGAAGVAGAADVADDVAGVDLVSPLEGRGPDQVRVLVFAALAEPADDDEVAVQPWIEGVLDHSPHPDRGQRRAA